MEDEDELRPVETPLYNQAKSLAEHLVLLLLRTYWSTTWSPSSLCKAVSKLAAFVTSGVARLRVRPRTVSTSTRAVPAFLVLRCGGSR